MTKQQIEAFGKISKGPWKFEQGQDEDDFIVTEPSGNTLCEPNAPLYADYTGLDETIRKIPLEEARANAIAIAALPDLLAEREEMIAMLKEINGLIPDQDIKKLIAKAEGE